jgi:hypothetical protein
MTADDDHHKLAAAWSALFDLMDNLPDQLRWDGVQYIEVSDMADRVRGVALHLDSAVRLSSGLRYESALALVRTALEQCLVDWLVFQGRTLVQRYTGVDEAKWADWQAARAAGDPWTLTIRDWTRTKRGEVRIVREGLFSEPDEEGIRHQISIYYFLLKQYRPTLGPPSVQLDEWSISREDLRRMAGENEALWRVYLTWSSVLTNLLENDLVDEVDAGRLSAHYRFLSGYAHPVVDHRQETYGRDALMRWPRYDHYSSELVLLYAITLGALELRNFIPALDSRPGATLADADAVEGPLQFAESATSYFWFLGAHPHAYDLWKARNEASFTAHTTNDSTPPSLDIAPKDVPYPADPMRRLVAMHASAHELMTGLVYQSPWPREDARFR